MSNISNRIAVCLVGEFRTWPRAQQYIFRYIDSLNCEVDFYFATWNTSCDKPCDRTNPTIIDDDKIKEFFNGRNLVGYKIVDFTPFEKFQNLRFYLQAHLSKVCGVLKRHHEVNNDFIYSQVIELRPDLYIRLNPLANSKFFAESFCDDFEILIGPAWINNGNTKNIPMPNDMYWRANSFGHDVLSNRTEDRLTYALFFEFVGTQTEHNYSIANNIHHQIFRYMNKRGLEVKTRNRKIMYETQFIQDIGYHVPLRHFFPSNLDELDIDTIQSQQGRWWSQ